MLFKLLLGSILSINIACVNSSDALVKKEVADSLSDTTNVSTYNVTNGSRDVNNNDNNSNIHVNFQNKYRDLISQYCAITSEHKLLCSTKDKTMIIGKNQIKLNRKDVKANYLSNVKNVPIKEAGFIKSQGSKLQNVKGSWQTTNYNKRRLSKPATSISYYLKLKKKITRTGVARHYSNNTFNTGNNVKKKGQHSNRSNYNELSKQINFNLSTLKASEAIPQDADPNAIKKMELDIQNDRAKCLETAYKLLNAELTDKNYVTSFAKAVTEMMALDKRQKLINGWKSRRNNSQSNVDSSLLTDVTNTQNDSQVPSLNYTIDSINN